LQTEQRVRHDLARLHGDQSALGALRQVTLVRLVAVEVAVHDAGAARLADELGPEAEQAAGGHEELETHVVTGRQHVLHLALAAAQVLHDYAHVLFRHVNNDVLDRLHKLVVDALKDDLRAGDLELEAFATHRLDQDAEVKLTPTGDLEDVWAVRCLD